MIKKTGFTLVEAIVGVAIFGLLAVGISMIMISAMQSWMRQNASVTMVEELRWAMEIIVNELREADKSEVTISPSGECSDCVRFEKDSDRNRWLDDMTVWYWQGTGTDDANVLYRGVDDFGLRSFTTAEGHKTQVVTHLVDNPLSEPKFSKSGDVVTIVLTTRVNDKEVTLRTNVRIRNED